MGVWKVGSQKPMSNKPNIHKDYSRDEKSLRSRHSWSSITIQSSDIRYKQDFRMGNSQYLHPPSILQLLPQYKLFASTTNKTNVTVNLLLTSHFHGKLSESDAHLLLSLFNPPHCHLRSSSPSLHHSPDLFSRSLFAYSLSAILLPH
jgi:hypothetical protein